jgi:putative ABC transport system ATP-binding protein
VEIAPYGHRVIYLRDGSIEKIVENQIKGGAE